MKTPQYVQIAGRLGILMMSSLLISCAAVKGYSGPERPDSQISLIKLAHSSDIDIGSATAEGVQFSGSGIKVLPGQHAFSINVTAKGMPTNCRSYTEFNRSGYHDCIKDAKKGKKNSCDCWDYTTTRKDCRREAAVGVCTGDLETRAGFEYDIDIDQTLDSVRLSPTEKGTNRRVGRGECRMGERQDITETQTVGSGRSAAAQEGITSCRD